MRRIPGMALALAMVLPAAACMTGPSAKNFRLVREARGAELMVEGSKSQLKGELLEVREQHLAIWDGCNVKLAPFASIRDSGFKGIDPKWVAGVPTAAEREELRVLSRYPTGIPASALPELLKCSGTTEPVIADI